MLVDPVVLDGRAAFIQWLEGTINNYCDDVHPCRRAQQDGDHRVYGNAVARKYLDKILHSSCWLYTIWDAVPGCAEKNVTCEDVRTFTRATVCKTN